MSEPLEISSALLRNLQNRKWRDPELAKEFEAGTAITRKASFGHNSIFARTRTFRTISDRKSRTARKRMMASWSILPPAMRGQFTSGETAVLTVIARECLRKGSCDLAYERIADLAGVGHTTVKNAIRAAKRNRALFVQERRVPGRKNLTNIITIFSKEWKDWVKRSGIGGKKLPAYTKEDKQQAFHQDQPVKKQPVFPMDRGLGIGSVRPDRCKPDTVRRM